MLASGLVIRRVWAGSEGVEPPAIGVGDRGATTGSSPSEHAHDGVRVNDEDAERTKERQLPANVGTAGIPGFPTSRLSLIE